MDTTSDTICALCGCCDGTDNHNPLAHAEAAATIEVPAYARDWPAEYRLGFAEADSDMGMTYDGDRESPRSVAYDKGRNDGRRALGLPD